MLPDSFWRGALIACLVLLPAGVRLWTGRSLARSAEDPALGERLLATQRVNGFALAFSIANLLFVSRRWWLWPLMLLAYIAAAYPLRRSLYEETWSLRGYLSFTWRLLLGSVGFWIVLALSPAIVGAAGARDWVAAVVLGAVLLVWQGRQGELLRTLMGTRPLTDPQLRARFEHLVQRCGIRTPRFEQLDLRGGVIANAIALASRRGSAVVFTDTLLARLEPEESAAICAHELAHLEHFTPQRLRQIALVTTALIAAGVCLPVIWRLADLHAIGMWVSWAGAFLLTLIWLARDRQKNETASDLRAVAITGDAEALVRALAKGYTISRMPRRLHPEFERQATHPSLARRIRDIRRAAGAAPASLPAATSMTAPDASTTVIFQADRLNWQEGEAAQHSLSYAHLSELRVDAKRSGRATLVAVESSGRRWEMPLLDVDVARAQAVLDVVDERLSGAAARSSVWPRAARALAAMLALIALPLGCISAALVTVLATLRPAPALLAAAGASGMIASALVLRDRAADTNAQLTGLSLLSATLGITLLIAARAAQRGDENPSGPRSSGTGSWIAAIGVLTLVSVALLSAQASSAVRLHLGARGIQSASVLPIACAAALLFWRPRGWRLGASVAAAIGFAAFSAGSIAFLDAFGRDALLVPAGPLRSTLIDGPALAELSLGFPASDLRLSPTGRHVAVTRGTGDEYGDASGTFFVGPARGPLVEVPATDLLFIGDEQVLTMEPRRGGIDLRRLRADAPGVRLWEHHVPGILVAQIAVDADARTWQAIGFDGTRRIVRVEGTIGEDALAPRRRTTGDRAGSLLALAAAGEAAVGVESRYAPALPFTLGLWRMGSWLPMGEMDSRIWAIVGSDRFDLGTSALEVRCVGERAGIPRLICVTFEGTRSRFVIVDPRSRRLSGVGLLPGRFFAGARASDGWLPGWYDGSSVAVRLDTGEVIRVAPPGGDDVVTEITGARYAAGAVLQNGSGSKIRVYSLNR